MGNMVNKKFSFIIVLFFFFSLPYSLGAKELKQLKLNETTYLLDSSTINIGTEKKLKEHDEIINRIHKACNSLYDKKELTKKATNPDSVQVSYGQQLNNMTYRKLNNFGMSSLSIDNNNIARSIHFVTPRPRGLTEEEKKSTIKNKIPASYSTISENTAIERARILLESIYGSEARYFDSVEVTVYEIEYVLYFTTKIKNDIFDDRSASVVINANTGYIDRFNGESKRDPDINFNYVPKISKQQVLEMYASECKMLKADITIDHISLSIYHHNGKRRWTWFVYGTRNDKKLYLSAHMFVDSETGEVITKGMD